MGLLQRGDERNSGKAVNSRQNKKADVKLDMLSDMTAAAAGDKHVGTERRLLQKRNTFSGFHYLKYLDQCYNFENRLFTVVYNHELSTEIIADDRFEETGSCLFDIKSSGKLHVKDTQWVCREFAGTDEQRRAYMERLSNSLIRDRIKALEITKLKLRHEDGSGSWSIVMESIIGSTTWMLLPPVTSMIKPTPAECVKFLELFELLADAVANNK